MSFYSESNIISDRYAKGFQCRLVGIKRLAGTCFWIGSLLALFCLVSISGCVVNTPKTFPEAQYYQVRATEIESQISIYRVAPGDTITINYLKDYRESDDWYRLDIGDKISINVRGKQEYSREVNVLPDGSISVPVFGRIYVRHYTLSELCDLLTVKYSEQLHEPGVDVIAIETGTKLESFLRLLRENYGDGDRTFFVRTDGRINLPLIGEVEVAGNTLAENQNKIAKAYKDIFSNISINIDISRSPQSSVAILGEVKKPGVYTLSRQVSPLFALAMAGGELDTADRSIGFILRQRPEGVEKILFDINGSILNIDNTPAPFVRAGDIVYIPKSGISNLDLFVDQYIRKLIPINTTYILNDNNN